MGRDNVYSSPGGYPGRERGHEMRTLGCGRRLALLRTMPVPGKRPLQQKPVHPLSNRSL